MHGTQWVRRGTGTDAAVRTFNEGCCQSGLFSKRQRPAARALRSTTPRRGSARGRAFIRGVQRHELVSLGEPEATTAAWAGKASSRTPWSRGADAEQKKVAPGVLNHHARVLPVVATLSADARHSALVRLPCSSGPPRAQ